MTSVAMARVERESTARAEFLETCALIYDRNEGCITPAEELFCGLLNAYQKLDTIRPADLDFYTKDYLDSVHLMRKARPVLEGAL